MRGGLTEGEREQKFSGHSLRAGLASSAEVDERYVQKQLGHASAEMTRKYQRRRDRFRVNLQGVWALKPPPLPVDREGEAVRSFEVMTTPRRAQRALRPDCRRPTLRSQA